MVFMDLHNACNESDHAKVKQLLDGGADLNGLINGMTPMHIVAGNGDIKIAKLLKEKGADCRKLDNQERIAMMCACINGHVEVVTLLLGLGEKKSPVSYQVTDKNGERVNYSVLMEAITRGREDVAMAIIESRQGEIALRYKTKDHTGKVTTPLRRLFEKMPAVAERAFRVITDIPESVSIPRDDERYEITFHYEYLDDFSEDEPRQALTAVNNTATPTANSIPSTSAVPLSTDREDSWWKPKEYDMSDHCLQILIDSDSKQLLKHPIVTTLLYRKWTSFAQYVFLLKFLLHFSFIMFLTSFTLRRTASHSPSDSDQFHNSGDPVGVGITGSVVILLSLISLGIEVFQMIKLQLRYLLDWINCLKVTLFIGSIMFVLVVANQCLCPVSWQWQIGALCVFLSWIDLILLVRMVPVIGLYVVMFIAIVKNFLVVPVLAVFLVLSFSFSFYMLFHDPTNIEEMIITPFHILGTSFIKTMTMVTGELDFYTLFRQDHYTGPGLQYLGITYPFWILFIVLMPILLSNLLIGVAIDNVNDIRENAKLKSLTLWVEFILLFEHLLFPSMRSKKRKEILNPDNCTIKPDEFPTKITNWLFWFRALELSYFDTPNYCIIKPDLSEDNKRLKENIKVLDAKIDKRMKTSSEDNIRLNEKMKVLDGRVDEMMKILRTIASQTNQGISPPSP